jgi:hypothetical protein
MGYAQMIITTTTEALQTTSIDTLMLILILFLFISLIIKEISSSLKSGRARRLNEALNMAVVPMIIAFIVIVVAKVADAFR